MTRAVWRSAWARAWAQGWALPLAAVVVCLALEAAGLADRSGGEPRNAGVRRYVVGEISREARLAQTFLVKADGLSSVTIHPRATSGQPAGAAILDLVDVTEGSEPRVVTQTTVPVATLAASASYTLRFPPQPSRSREYRLEIAMVDVPRGGGVGLVAARGDGHPNATFFININGRARWGDLVFETTVDGAQSNMALLQARLSSWGVPAATLALMLLLAAKAALLYVLMRAIARNAGAAAGQSAPISPAPPA